jgi:hypothetical protein
MDNYQLITNQIDGSRLPNIPFANLIATSLTWDLSTLKYGYQSHDDNNDNESRHEE